MRIEQREMMMEAAASVEAYLYQWAKDHNDKDVWRELVRRAEQDGVEFWIWLLSTQQLIQKGLPVREAMDIYSPQKLWTTPSWKVR